MHKNFDKVIHGGCLCGSVKYEINGPVHLLSHCHCSMCRKFSGSAFLTFARTRVEHFAWVLGKDKISTYASSANGIRCFCTTCGSPLPIVREALPNALIPAGTLENDPGIRPTLHIFASDKAPWLTIDDSLPQAAQWPTEINLEWLGHRNA